MSGAFAGYVKDAKLELRAFRENLHDTTWVSPEQGKKPLFIPQGTTYALYSIIYIHHMTVFTISGSAIQCSLCTGELIYGDQMVSECYSFTYILSIQSDLVR